MRVLFVSVEVAPFAKVGGLADVAGALPKALRRLGHDARVVMPLYRMIEDDPRWQLATTLDEFEVRMGSHWSKMARFRETELDGLPVGFIGTDEWYPLSVDSETLYQPGGMQHLFFCQAVLTAMQELDWIPDIIHCNDWHTGFLPLLMREKNGADWDDVASVYTIHNLAYQGDFDPDVLDAQDLPRSLFNSEQVEAWGRVNFLKTGCVYADRVNTVSETYAREIQTPEFGCDLEGLMAHLDRQGRLAGILNGVDTDVFNPLTDPDIPAHFSVQDLSGKAECRRELLKEVGLPEIAGAPVFGVVSRLSSQKGMDLMLKAAEAMFSLPILLIVQGLGDPALAQAFSRLEARFPSNFRFVNRFDAPIAQRIYAGCDGFLMPSSFEPCGLGQMIAMRYGTVPVVRSTGGLADTIFEGSNGFVFQNKEPMELLAAVERARFAFQNPDGWRKLMVRGMKTDVTWDNSAKLYARLYEEARASRGVLAVKTA
jgi:starch synthase